MAKTILKKVGVFSVAKLQAIIMGIVGIPVGIITALILLTAITSPLPANPLGDTFMNNFAEPFVFNALLAVIITPILFGIVGFISGAVGAFLYNLIASRAGGVEMEFEETKA